jgi:uncharacterized protein (DUF302 family)
MPYYITKSLSMTFDAALQRVRQGLQKEGFGVLTEIDVQDTLKKKLNVELRGYRILGACNPPFAWQALQAEDKIGLLLPCNVIVQETMDGRVEAAAIDPVASMERVGNPKLAEIAGEVKAKLTRVIAAL